MGQDKASLRLHPDQATFLRKAWLLCRQITPATLISVSACRAYPDYLCVVDKEPGQGPLGGLLSALLLARKLKVETVLALACDLPLMRLELLTSLLRAHRRAPEHNLATIYQNPVTFRLEMLAAIYSSSALPWFQAAIQAGRRALKDVLPLNKILCLPYKEKDAQAFLNCNTPRDIETIERILPCKQKRGPERTP